MKLTPQLLKSRTTRHSRTHMSKTKRPLRISKMKRKAKKKAAKSNLKRPTRKRTRKARARSSSRMTTRKPSKPRRRRS